MGLFSFFNINRKEKKDELLNEGNENSIPKDIFIEESEPIEEGQAIEKLKGIDVIYNFLQADYESKGYSDALTNPDDSYRNDNIDLIKLDLEILIQKVETYYEDLIREIDFHIGSRGRAGLVDLVEELNSKKVMVTEHMGKVKELEENLVKGEGMVKRLILSYQRGFMRGLSALTHSEVMDKQL